jgi:hypothetical protein
MSIFEVYLPCFYRDTFFGRGVLSTHIQFFNRKTGFGPVCRKGKCNDKRSPRWRGFVHPVPAGLVISASAPVSCVKDTHQPIKSPVFTGSRRERQNNLVDLVIVRTYLSGYRQSNQALSW